MIKNGGRKMDMSFYSEKCKCKITVHSIEGKECFQMLEEDDNVLKFESNLLITDLDSVISFEGIRTMYKGQEWITDFHVTLVDGSSFVLEVLRNLSSANIQMIEMSRRYWTSKGMDFKVFLGKEISDEVF